MYAITISASSRVQAFWEQVKRASAFERTSSIEALGYAPHLTLARFGEATPNSLLEAARSLQQTRAFSLTFDHIGYFDVNPIVLWLSPRPSQQLLDLHAELHEHVDPQLCDPHYLPSCWTPHLTTASSVDVAHRDKVMEFVSLPFEPLSLSFDAIDVVSWPPVRILSRMPLQQVET
ncbi:2'-5' RNA ligase family protein (plasmid) [Agrobacterium leguminum]|uniref:2'-5' RNA ligase family protein n=1 Tax=Agrobacterium deltaense NCPPB 1641 TaxID=1183425 RepID=A0A1S7UC35_9HYPH|nr:MULTISPECIES: 2'-5' RNA ligase family protein [Agrobacterium]WFS69405.1 2'-5' RNA ligase family protein [Agrobacterium leguminum]CVI64453.1 conserved hypothetical protein [Agrobacterium deltaense NCPPB 1641]